MREREWYRAAWIEGNDGRYARVYELPDGAVDVAVGVSGARDDCGVFFTAAQAGEIIGALQDAVGGEGAWGSARCLAWLHEHCDVVQVVMRERSAIVRPVEVVLPGAVGWTLTGTEGTVATVGDLRKAVHNAATAIGIPCPLGEACPVEGCPPVAEPEPAACECPHCALSCSNYAKREESGGGA